MDTPHLRITQGFGESRTALADIHPTCGRPKPRDWTVIRGEGLRGTLHTTAPYVALQCCARCGQPPGMEHGRVD